MRYGLDLPNFGDFADLSLIAEIAATAEASGWDGVFLWDHIGRSTQFPPGLPFADVTVALTVIAQATEGITFGPLVTPLPRRRVQKVARELTSLDHLSGGRVVLGVGIGSPPDSEFEAFGEDADLRRRGDVLDESLELLSAFWSGEPVDFTGEHLSVHTEGFDPRPVQQPRIPIWIAARWPSKGRTLRRARRWDGIVPTAHPDSGPQQLSAEEIADIAQAMDGGEVVVTAPVGADPRPYEEAGATWWAEICPDRGVALKRASESPSL